jgi:hypothetical protein
MANNNQPIDFTFFDRVPNIFDLGGRRGVTDYIDFLRDDEILKNMMMGIDLYGRKFLTMKIGGIDLDTMNFFKCGQVFFERYTDSPYIVSGEFVDMAPFIATYGGTRPAQYQLINDLVDGKLVKVNEEHRFNSSNHNVIIANMDYWENRSAKIIQKNWDICRYNPNYSMCKKIVGEQFDQYNEGVNGD